MRAGAELSRRDVAGALGGGVRPGGRGADGLPKAGGDRGTACADPVGDFPGKLEKGPAQRSSADCRSGDAYAGGRIGSGVDFETLSLTNELGEETVYMLNCRWNRRTREGTVSACEPTGGAIIGKVMDAVTEVESAPLFWYDEVFYNSR